MRTLRCALLAAALAACGEGAGVGDERAASPLRVAVDTTAGSDSVRFLLLGLSSRELADLGTLSLDDAAAPRAAALFTISIDDAEASPIIGRYTVRDSALAFHPSFPLDRGRRYRVRADASALPAPRADSLVASIVALGAITDSIGTRVSHVSIADTVPENLLRFYIEFSAPMSRVGALPYLTLLDAAGNPVPSAFLPLDADFWNADRTRYTVFLDPGRVKQGIRPNEDLGRAIRSGRGYTLRVDSLWPDENGAHLRASYTAAFRVVAPVERALDIDDWTIVAPAPRTRAPLTVAFPRALDRGLLVRAIGVEHATGERVDGDVRTGAGDRSWSFTPRAEWKLGRYRVVALSILEDVAGNRLSGPFEVDAFDRVDSGSPPQRYVRDFVVR